VVGLGWIFLHGKDLSNFKLPPCPVSISADALFVIAIWKFGDRARAE